MVSRVRVVGSSGAGKTTFARTLARRLGLPHLELDSVNHQPGWRQAEDEEFAGLLDDFLAASPHGWVVDGNYRRHTRRLTEEAVTVVWLDLPRRTSVARVVRRSLGRMASRRELWNGNRESWVNLLRRDPTENIVLWAWLAPAANREEYQAIWAEHAHDDAVPRWVRLTSPREVRRWLLAQGVDG